MDLDLDELVAQIGLQLPSARGRRPRESSVPLEVGEPRPIRAEDVVGQSSKTLPTSTPPSLQKLRSRHHQLAQQLSSGMTDFQVSVSLGYSLSRISILKSDPTFRELLSYYEKQHEALHLDVQERLINLGLDSIETLQSRLDDDPDEFSNKELLEVAEMALDRTGHGKSSTVSVMHGLDDETHALLMAQHEARKQGRVLNLSDGEFIDVTGSAERSDGACNGAESRSEATPTHREQGPDDLFPPGREIPHQPTSFHSSSETQERLDDREGAGVSEKMERLDQGAQLLLFPTSPIRRDREE
jgi:hypothetical protein